MIIQTFHITEEKVNKDQTFVVVSQQTYDHGDPYESLIIQISKVLDTRLLSPAKFYKDCAILEYAYICEVFDSTAKSLKEGLIKSFYVRPENLERDHPWFKN